MVKKLEQKSEQKLVAGKFRDYVFTQYNLDFDFSAIKNVAWGIAGRETCPTTGRVHLQGAIRFSNPRSHGGVGKEFKCFVEPMTKPILASERYCSKEADLVWEYGAKPQQGKRSDLEDLVELAKVGTDDKELIISNPVQYCYHYRALEKIRDTFEPKRDWVTEVILLIGPSGCGKTRTAIQDGACKLEYDGKFVAGYSGEDVVLFDDIDEFFVDRGKRQWFLNLTDRYPMKIRVVGGFRNWKPRKIYFTMNEEQYLTSSQFWNDPAVKRRVSKVEHMFLEQK